MQIAIIAWGSLVWNPGTLNYTGDFEPVGPRLSLEFSRISKDGRLTLVIDETNGVECPTYVAASGYDLLDRAIENLRARENTNTGRIGFLSPDRNNAGGAPDLNPRAFDAIRQWLAASGFEAAIWTALPSNYEEQRGCAYSVEDAVAYLRALDRQAHDNALDYIRRAPPEIRTPLRDRVEAEFAVSYREPMRDELTALPNRLARRLPIGG